MYKRLATAALAGMASAAVAPLPSISVCTETSTLIYRSTTAYSTYYVTHTLSGSGYASPTESTVSPTGGYGGTTSSSSMAALFSSASEAPSSAAGGIGSWIISPGPYSSPASPVTTSLPPVVSHPAPSGNATYSLTGAPTGTASGSPAQQTGNAGVANKPVGALLGLVGVAAALL